MPKTSGPSGANGSDNRGSIHLTLQGKGGVGKSLIASVLAQYFLEHGRDVRCVDTDPVNRTLAQYNALGADWLNLRDEHNRIDQRSFDTLMERFLTEHGATFGNLDKGTPACSLENPKPELAHTSHLKTC
jgi:adenylylsulfate kinase-like enzyme